MSDTEHVQESAERLGAGARLRAAREARGQTVQQAAQALRLEARVVQALEAEERAALPADMFIKGYLRAYARHLGLDPDTVVGEFPLDLHDPALMPNITRPQVRSSDAPVRLVTYAVVLGLVALLAIWWATQGSDRFAERLPVEDAGGSVTVAAGDAVPDEVAGPEPLAEPPIVEPAAPAPAPTAASERAAAPAPEPAPQVQSAPADALAARREAAPAANEAAPRVAAAAPKSRLVLRFEADSWTEVTDASGERLAYNLVAAGRELSLEGEPPFTVFLGYSPGVAVTYDGARFDQSRYNRANDAARFRIGQARH
ncbi:helix-turn-helix domain-containing protein [Ectothiorhodospiraceae bacterium 2226]|nr:helix-turn-helix domain-containing protein [Ectothiorhodospiraceae bacterium 2226]